MSHLANAIHAMQKVLQSRKRPAPYETLIVALSNVEDEPLDYTDCQSDFDQHVISDYTNQLMDLGVQGVDHDVLSSLTVHLQMGGTVQSFAKLL